MSQQPTTHLLYDSPMPVRWLKCNDDDWCPLNTVKLSHAHFDNMAGVYIIWHGGREPGVLSVGQGYVREKLAAAKRDPAIQAYRRLRLYVTWARVAARYRNGVVAFLASHYQPKLWKPAPFAEPIPVDLP